MHDAPLRERALSLSQSTHLGSAAKNSVQGAPWAIWRASREVASNRILSAALESTLAMDWGSTWRKLDALQIRRSSWADSERQPGARSQAASMNAMRAGFWSIRRRMAER